MQRIGLREVAALAGVSTATVSNTINHPERVLPATRDTVLAAIRELGFVPNHHARALTGAPSRVIGLVLLDVLSPFYMEVAHAVERAAAEAGYVVILATSENSQDREADVLRSLRAQQVGGVLLAPSGDCPPNADSVNGLPMVLIDHESPEYQCSVAVDHVSGGGMAGEHLIGLGHERIAFLSGLPSVRQFEQRRQGIGRAMESAGLDPESLIEMRATGIGIQSGELAVQSMLESAQALPTGIACGNDMLAFGAYRALAAAGIRVPEEVALVGYDDSEFAANWIVPLTTVRQPIREMGRLAAELLLQHAKAGDNHEHRRLQLQPELVVRRSSGG